MITVPPTTNGSGHPLSVALVAPSLRLGGLERVVRDLAVGLRDRGVRTAVFVTESPGEYAEGLARSGVPVTDCSSPRPRIARVPFRLLRQLSRFRPDIIHGHSGSWLPCAVARSLLRKAGLVFTDHGRYPPEARYRRFLERNVYYPQTHRLVAVSRELAEYLETFLDLSQPPGIVPNGVDLSAYVTTDPTRRAVLRAEWGVGADDIVAISVGRLEPVKNHAGLLDALAQARAAVPGLRLAIAGIGQLEDQLRSRAEALGLTEHVFFLGHRRDVADCLAASDVFVSASTSEGLPISLLEAMAAGLPTVATAVGGIPDALGTPPGGVLVPPGRPGDLADALARMASEPDRMAALGVVARRRARAFTLDAVVQRYCDLYADVLAERGGPDRAIGHAAAGGLAS